MKKDGDKTYQGLKLGEPSQEVCGNRHTRQEVINTSF